MPTKHISIPMIETKILEIMRNNVDIISSNHIILTKLRIHLKLNVALKDWLRPARNIKGPMIRWTTNEPTIATKTTKIVARIIAGACSSPSNIREIVIGTKAMMKNRGTTRNCSTNEATNG